MPVEMLSGLDGVVSLVPHASMPGVLVRVETTYGVQRVRVVRSVEGGPWEPVLSGDPARLMPDGGVRSAHAFDLAAVPGRRVAYTVQWSPDEPPAAKYAVSVRLPDLGACEAWLKHAADPHLSRKVTPLHPLDRQTSGWSSSTGVYGARHPHLLHGGVSGVGYALSLCVKGHDDVHALRRLVETPGAMLLQASADHGLDETWLAWTGETIDEDRLTTSGWQHRHITIPVVEVAAPATKESRMVIPGATYEDLSRDARTWTEYATEFPSSFDALLAACGQPYGDARTDSTDEGLRVDA